MRLKPVVVYLTMKGGVGKTTLAANITRSIADLEKKKILLIDADSQCNLTQLFVPPEQLDEMNDRTIYQALAGHKPYSPADLKEQIYYSTKTGSQIDLIRGSFETFRLAVDSSPLLEQKTLGRFTNFIAEAKNDYDLIVLDTNPSATLVTMQALAVSNFLVAPISFDKFSMRGIHLITSLLYERYEWLTNPLRVRIVPNRIKRPTDERTKSKLLEHELKLREAFPDLSRCIVPSYIRESSIISNASRGAGFVADQAVPNRNHLNNLLADLNNVAIDLLATFRAAFRHETENQTNVIRAMRQTYQTLFGRAVERH